MYVKLTLTLPLLFSKRGRYDLRFWDENYVRVFLNISYFRTISAFHKTSKYSQTQTMNDNFTFLIFTYHNVFHSLLASFRLRKWRLLALVSSGCRRMLTCVLSFTSAFPTQRRWVMIKTNFQPKIGLKQPNALTQRSHSQLEVCYPTRTRGSRNTVGFRVGFRVNV